ncbi:DNA-binding GntR family transcriptional regulator [Skermanella aerolata]|uniref:GntR family transcriptional regulator n=1 Tax=Skermanella aerolata TaxID=393310 RepID=UPI003D1A7B56
MLHEDVVAHLRDKLIDGVLPPGSRVPEKELCAELGVSRTPLREALKVLASEGYIVLLPNRGARVAKMTARNMEELFEVCGGMEALAGELACHYATDAEIAGIKALHDRMAEFYEARNLAGYYPLNRAIHEAIVRATHNSVLMNLYENVSARIRRARFVVPMPPDHWRLAMAEHEAILNALQRRDAIMLSSILKTHLRNKSEQVERAGFAESDETPAPAATARKTPAGKTPAKKPPAKKNQPAKSEMERIP